MSGGLFVRRSNGRTRVAAGVYMGGRTLQKVGQGAAAWRSWYRAQFLPGSCSEWRRVLLAFSALVFLRSLSDTRVFGLSLIRASVGQSNARIQRGRASAIIYPEVSA